MKLINRIEGDDFCIFYGAIPQHLPSLPIKWSMGGMLRQYGGWYFSFGVGKFTFGKSFYRTPGEVLRSLMSDLSRLKLALTFRPVYAGWRNYWMVDHVEDWGVKRFPSGLAYLKWAAKEEAGQDENIFSCWLTDADDYAEYQEAVEAEKNDGYRRTSRDHGLEQFEEYGW